MTIPDFAQTSVFALVTKAQELAELLDHAGMATNGELVRELCRRVVPVKIVPTRGKPMRLVADPIGVPIGKAWCDQCEQMVDGPCQSQFCKRVA